MTDPNENTIRNKSTAVIIGSGPGLARAVARRFGRDGWRIILVARDERRLGEMVLSLQEEQVDAIGRCGDAADGVGLQRLVREISEEFGAIELLIYNAASIRKASLLEQPVEDIALDLMAGVGGAIAVAQEAARIMTLQGTGTMLFTGGGLAVDPWPDYVTLSTAKAGLRAMTIAMVKDPDLNNLRIGHVIIHGGINDDTGAQLAEHYAQLYYTGEEDWQSETEIRL